MPAGALAAVVFAISFHLIVSCLLVPQPVARDAVRYKVIGLTQERRPRVLIAGDSRAEKQVVPAIIAARLGLPEADVINMARPACESSAVLAVYREFSDRFAPSPVMLISVSLFSVDDRSNQDAHLNDEVLWSLGPIDRLRLVEPKRALLATFLPERALFRLIRDRLEPPPVRIIPENGFRGLEGTPSPERIEPWIELVKSRRTDGVDITGLRWGLLERDLRSLVSAGVQVVVLDGPESPFFLNAIAGTPLGEAYERFHLNLAALCRRMDLPLLAYGLDSLGAADPQTYFLDLVHLNRTGAAVFSSLVGEDLRSLVGHTRLRIPASG